MPFPQEEDPLLRYVNKTVSFRFDGRDFQFHLSHALFSSFDIDDGSRFLLKSVAARMRLGDVRSILDVGCGVGALGICVGAHAPQAHVLMQDRDTLAAGFAARNAALNGLGRTSAVAGLAFQGLGESRFDLLLCNIPAKAGTPVIESFFREASVRLSAEGVAAFVIVAPLAELARTAAARAGLEISWTEQNARYSVLHLRRDNPTSGPEPAAADISPYIRGRAAWSFAGTSYEIETVHSLPDFDTVGYSLANVLSLLSEMRVSGRVLIWNPGQGHLCAFLLSRKGNSISAISIAGRDTLELAITERNLRSRGRPPRHVRPLPAEAALATAWEPGSFDLLCAAPLPVPRVPWQADLLCSARVLLSPGGRLLVSSTSTETQRLLASHEGFRPVESRKHAGFRAVLLDRL